MFTSEQSEHVTERALFGIPSKFEEKRPLAAAFELQTRVELVSGPP